jgi:hypothetical protein
MAIRGTGGGADDNVKRTAFFLTAFFVVSLFCLQAAFAQVHVRMRVILASNAGQDIDPSLRDVHKELGSLFSFTSYRLVRDESLNLSLNQPARITGRTGKAFLEVTLTGQHKNVAELRLRVVREGTEVLNTQVRLFSGRTVVVGGPRHGEGVVIYVVSGNF